MSGGAVTPRPGRYDVLRPALMMTSGRLLAFAAAFFIPVVLARVFTVAEFGTYGHAAMFGALRAENQAHHWGRPGAAINDRARARLREVFCPASAEWRTRVLTAGTGLIERAAAGLAEAVGVPA